MQIIRAAIQDFLELLAWPVLIAVVPWALGFRIARAISQRGWFYRDEAEAALILTTQIVPQQDHALWIERYCFTRIMDHADLYISLLHGRRWVEREVRCHGRWPSQRPFVSLTFHWGNGLLALRSLQYAVGPFAGVALAVDKSQFRGRPLRYAYVKLRNWETGRAIGGGLSYTGSAARQFVAAIERGTSICGLFDVPPLQNVKSAQVPFLGSVGTFPRGAARLAARHNVPLVVFRSLVDPESGRRELWIDSILAGTSESVMIESSVHDLESAIQSQPAAWHMWMALPAFFTHPTVEVSIVATPKKT